MRLSEIQKKDLVNINTGEKVGNIIDVNIDSSGNIISFIISSGFRFFSSDEVEITFSDIVKIGEDVILVKSE